MWMLPVRGYWMVFAISACCCQGFLLLGYDQGLMSGLVGANNQFGNDFGHPSTTTQGTIVAIYDIGCAVGCLLVLFFGEQIGRKRLIMAGGTIMIIGTAILTSSNTIAQLIVGRIVTGLGNGLNSASIPVYQAETCGGVVRGTLVCLNTTITIVGLVIAYWFDYGLSFVNSTVQWRLPAAFQAVFAICLVVQASMLPDSPRWLIAHDRKEEGAKILAILEDKDSPDDPHVMMKVKEIEVSLAQESAGGPFRYRELLEGGPLGNFRRICLCVAVNFTQIFSGANMINYLAPVLYQNTMGLSRNLSLILGGATAVIFLFASITPLWTVDRYGRRPLLLISAVGQSFCFMMTAILLSIGTRSTAYGATAMIFLFQISMGIGYLPIPWLYPAEISTTRIRSKGSAIGAFTAWISTFAIVEMTPPAIANISWRIFIIFAILNACWVPLIYCFFPETKGLELEDIDHIFDRGGITGGVWETRGMTVERHRILRDVEEVNKGEADSREDEKY